MLWRLTNCEMPIGTSVLRCGLTCSSTGMRRLGELLQGHMLTSRSKNLEASLAAMNSEHVEIVRQLVMSKVEKEDVETELVRYKMM